MYGSRNLEIILLCCTESVSLYDVLNEEYIHDTQIQRKNMIQDILLKLTNAKYIGLLIKIDNFSKIKNCNISEACQIIQDDSNFAVDTMSYNDIELYATKDGCTEYNNIVKNNEDKQIKSYLEEQFE